MTENDWYNINKSDRENSIGIFKELFGTINPVGKSSKDEVETPNETSERITIEKKKLLDIVKIDLIMEYRFALTYLDKIRGLDLKDDKKTQNVCIQLASHSMTYSALLNPIIEKLGEKSGKIFLPYKIENFPLEKIIGSHILIEKKILGSYEGILSDFELDEWLRKILIYIIENKSTNLKNLIDTRNI